MKNLYTFSKKSWHVRFFRWLFAKDATEIYKTMCPYFWTYVLIITFLPIILIIKLFGAAGTRMLDNARTYSQRKEQKLLAELKERFYAALEAGQAEVYKLSKSKCWKRLNNDLYCKVEYHEMQKFREMKETEYWRIRQEKNEQKAIRQEASQRRDEKLDDIKDSIFGKILGYSVLIAVVAAALYLLFILFRWLIGLVDWVGTDWGSVGRITAIAIGIVVAIIGVIYLVYLFLIHLVTPFFSWMICHLKQVNWPKIRVGKYIAWPFVIFWKFLVLIGKCIAIVCDMIYNFYKKRCPIITWKEE